MKRLFTISFVLAIAGCGGRASVPADTTTTVPGGTEMMGPDADGQFYVLGDADNTVPGSSVTVTNTLGESAVVTAEADGSWAALIWSSIDQPVSISTQSASVSQSIVTAQKINVNYASLRGLESVPGIGPALAARILDYRIHTHLFSEPMDLVNVQGIGTSSIQPMLPYVETKIDINTATRAQLLVLPLVGEVRSRAIVAYRDSYGSFQSTTDLLFVPGITPAIYQAVAPYISCGSIATHPGAQLVNVNTASAPELETLPGIGTARSKAIVSYRSSHGNFQTRGDLIAVPGIGPVTLQTIWNLVTVGVFDLRVGTFTANGSWELVRNDGSTSSGVFAHPVLVTFDHAIVDNHLIVTLVGASPCSPNVECAPFSLDATVLDQTATDVSYELAGTVPSSTGDYAVTASDDTQGSISEAGILSSFVATQADGSTWRVSLSGHRVMP